MKNKTAKKSVYFQSGSTKHSMNSSATLKLSSITEKKKQEINEILDNLMKQYINSPQELMKYMKKNGMQIYEIKNANVLLAKIYEQEGFLTPLKGTKAIVLNFIIGLMSENKFKFNLTTKEMFIFNDKNTEIYTIARALYKYYGYKNNLSGYDYKSQEVYKRVYIKNKKLSNPLRGLKPEEIFACKEALARDLESINYTISLSERYEGSKKVLEKIKDDDSASV